MGQDCRLGERNLEPTVVLWRCDRQRTPEQRLLRGQKGTADPEKEKIDFCSSVNI